MCDRTELSNVKCVRRLVRNIRDKKHLIVYKYINIIFSRVKCVLTFTLINGFPG